MTRQEIEKRIEELENKRFFLAMKDFWSRADFEKDEKMWREVIELKKELEKA